MSFEKSLLTLWFFRLLTSCSPAIKSIPHCQWSWSSLDLTEEMLALLLLWDLYIHSTLMAVECMLCIVPQLIYSGNAVELSLLGTRNLITYVLSLTLNFRVYK